MKNEKTYINYVLWAVSGFLCRDADLYLFSFGTANLVPPVLSYIKLTLNSSYLNTLTHFIFFYIISFIVTFSFSFLLSNATGMKIRWLLLFIVGAIGYSVYETIEAILLFDIQYYETLPFWAKKSFIASIIGYFMVIPGIIWFAAFMGNILYRKKQEKLISLSPNSLHNDCRQSKTHQKTHKFEIVQIVGIYILVGIGLIFLLLPCYNILSTLLDFGNNQPIIDLDAMKLSLRGAAFMSFPFMALSTILLFTVKNMIPRK